jgi:acyl-CoA synthetase (AMP-forming)/AMP-acid ligase II
VTARAETMARLLRERAEARPESLALRLEDGGSWRSWTWQTFWERSCAAAATLREAGVGPGDRVLMLVPEVREAVPTLFGLWILGAVPIQVGVPHRLSDLAAFLGELTAMALRLEARALIVAPRFAALAPPAPPVPVVPAIVPPERSSWEPELPAADVAPALVQLTSGSMGHPRGVVISQPGLMRHMAAMSTALPSHAQSVAVSWLPLHHDMGLIGGLLFPFYNGFPAHMISPAVFKTRPLGWLEAMSGFRATICAAPPSAYAICLRLGPQARAAALDLSAWECAMVGAEPIAPALLRRFADVFAPLGFAPATFFPVYGLAEATVAVTFPALGAPTRFDRIDRAALEEERRAVPVAATGTRPALEFTGVGRPIPGTEIRIVDAAGRTLGEREVGEIHVRSSSLMEGYFRDPVATAAALVDGWLATGDLGYTVDGVLFVTGRAKELIIKGGQSILPSALEEVVGADPDVRSGCAAAVGIWASDRQTELVYVVCETRVDADRRGPLAERLRERLRVQGVAVDRVVLVGAGVLPRTTSGKIRRSAVRAALSGGDRDPEEALLAVGAP